MQSACETIVATRARGRCKGTKDHGTGELAEITILVSSCVGHGVYHCEQGQINENEHERSFKQFR
jgi:hypothetical protein